MIYIEAPNRDFVKDRLALFLAGGITGCPDFQTDVVEALKDTNVIVFNPRRKNFDIKDPTASRKQITWEHDMFEYSDMLCFWFCKETIQPIVLLKLGKYLIASTKPAVIGIAPGYSRESDVRIQTTLDRPDVPIVDSFDRFLKEIKKMIEIESLQKLRE
jgi:hypothetical protein